MQNFEVSSPNPKVDFDPSYNDALLQRFNTDQLSQNPKFNSQKEIDLETDSVKNLVLNAAASVLNRNIDAYKDFQGNVDDLAKILGFEFLALGESATKRKSFKGRRGFTLIDSKALELSTKNADANNIELVSVAIANSPDNKKIVVPIVHFHKHPNDYGIRIQKIVEDKTLQTYGKSISQLLQSKADRARINRNAWLRKNKGTLVAFGVISTASVITWFHKDEIKAGISDYRLKMAKAAKEAAIKEAENKFIEEKNCIYEIKGIVKSLDAAPTDSTKLGILGPTPHLQYLFNNMNDILHDERFNIDQKREIIPLLGKVLSSTVKFKQKVSLDNEVETKKERVTTEDALKILQPAFLHTDEKIRHSAVDWYRQVVLNSQS